MGPGAMLVLTAACAAQGQPNTAYKDGLGPIPSTQHDGKSRGHTQAASGPPGELLSSGHEISKSRNTDGVNPVPLGFFSQP
jgi:hypothetical protein